MSKLLASIFLMLIWQPEDFFASSNNHSTEQGEAGGCDLRLLLLFLNFMVYSGCICSFFFVTTRCTKTYWLLIYRIIESLELEGTVKCSSSPCNEEGHAQLDQVTPSSAVLNVSRDRASTASLGNLSQWVFIPLNLSYGNRELHSLKIVWK